MGIEIKFDLNYNKNDEGFTNVKFELKDDVFNYLKSLSESFFENYGRLNNSKIQSKNLMNFFNDIDYEKKSDYYGFWKNNSKNGEGILNLNGEEYKGFWLNNQYLGNKIILKDENNQKLFERKNFEDYSFNKLEKNEKILTGKKKYFWKLLKK